MTKIVIFSDQSFIVFTKDHITKSTMEDIEKSVGALLSGELDKITVYGGDDSSVEYIDRKAVRG